MPFIEKPVQNIYIGDKGGWKPGENTIAYYPLNSKYGINDKSGNGYNFTLVGGSIEESDGIEYFKTTAVNQGLYSSAPYNSTHTCMVWFHCDDGNSNLYQSIIDFGNNRSSPGILGCWYRNNSSYGLCIGTYGNPETMTRYTIDITRWHLITFVGSGGSEILYLDGVQVATLSHSKTPSAVFNIAKAGDNTTEGMIGKFSRVIYENRQRTVNEIADYYNLTKSNYGY